MYFSVTTKIPGGDVLTVGSGYSSGAPVKIFAPTTTETLLVTNNVAALWWSTDSNAGTVSGGFTVRWACVAGGYSATSCSGTVPGGGTITAAEPWTGTLMSDADGSGGGGYASYLDCTWNIVCPFRSTWTATVAYGFETCADTAYVGQTGFTPLYALENSGSTGMTVPINTVTVTLHTDTMTSSNGMTLDWTCVAPPVGCNSPG